MHETALPDPPIAAKKPCEIIFPHGERVVDDYYWLRDDNRSNAEVIDYLKQENEYLEKIFQVTGMSHLQEEIYKEFVDWESRIAEPFAPWRSGEYWYCRVHNANVVVKRFKRGNETYPQRVLSPSEYQSKDVLEEAVISLQDIDNNGNGVSFFEVSPNHQLVAFGCDYKGNERYTLKVKNLVSQQIQEIDTIHCVGSIEPWFTCCWTADSRYLFYIALDDTGHSKKVYRHEIGLSPQNDVLVYYEQQEEYVLSLSKTNDQKYFLLSCYTSSSNELWYLSTSQPEGKFKRLLPRKPNVLYFADHHSGYFYVGTNERGINGEILQIPIDILEQQQLHSKNGQEDDTCKQNSKMMPPWRVVLSHDDSVQRLNLTCFRDHIIVYEQFLCKKQIRVVELKPFQNQSEHCDDIHKSISFEQNFHYISLPEEVYTLAPGNIDDNYTYFYREKAFCPYDSDSFVYSYTSFTTPKTIVEYNMRTRTQTIQWQQKIANYNPNDYHSERIFAPSFDGVLIPISLVWRKDLRIVGKPSPLIISGYGGYGASKDSRFSLYKLSLLNRGVIVAIAHVRGGNEMGKFWHLAGKLLKKKNSFYDLIACCEYLIEKQYTESSLLAIRGRSAGGLLVCATAILRPQLMKSVVAEVPFVDVIMTMSDRSIPWVAFEFDEWGDPNDTQCFQYMKSYCPVTNIKRTDYPNFLITTGFHDARVQFWEPAKFVAKLRAHKTDKNFVFLKTYFDGGHFARDRSLMWAFLLATLKTHDNKATIRK
jgi:oligopeptidase B